MVAAGTPGPHRKLNCQTQSSPFTRGSFPSASAKVSPSWMSFSMSTLHLRATPLRRQWREHTAKQLLSSTLECARAQSYELRHVRVASACGSNLAALLKLINYWEGQQLPRHNSSSVSTLHLHLARSKCAMSLEWGCIEHTNVGHQSDLKLLWSTGGRAWGTDIYSGRPHDKISFAGHIQGPCLLQGRSRLPERSGDRQSAALTGSQTAAKHDLRQERAHCGRARLSVW